MVVSYKRLWHLLIDRNMNKTDLKRATRISSSTFANMVARKNVSMDVLLKICDKLQCDFSDIVEAKFDSVPELVLARVLEQESDVKNWLRPAKMQFNITYNRGKRYEPDFVVETEDTIYLVEVKGEDKLTDPDVIAKKKRGIQYCQVATNWGKANGYKAWQYLFIPSMQIKSYSTFSNLSKMFVGK